MKNFLVSHRLHIFFTFTFLFNLIALRYYPVASVDESWQSSNSFSVFNKSFVSINYPFFLQNTGAPYLMNFLLGLIYNLFGMGVIQGRIFILILSMILLFLLYRFTKSFFGKDVAFWAIVFFASTRIFLFSSHFIRNEVLLCIFLIISVWSFFKYLNTKRLYYIFITGLLLAISTEIHQNGLFFIIALTASWAITFRSLKIFFSKAFVVYISGIALYSLYYYFAHVNPNISLYISERSYSIFKDHAIPILSLPIKEVVLSELDRYIGYFYPTRIIEFLLIIFSILWAIKQKDRYLKFNVYFVSIVSLQLLIFASNKTEVYLIYCLLLISPVLSKFFHEFFTKMALIGLFIPDPKNNKFISIFKISFFNVFILLLIFNYLILAGVLGNNSSYSYGKIHSLMDPYITESSLVLGPTNYFLPLNHVKYRSFYVLPWYRILRGYNTKQAIEEIRPDYIIVDKQVEYMLEEDSNNISDTLFYKNLYKIPKTEFYEYLYKNATLVSEYNSAYYNDFKLYKVVNH